MDNRELKIKLWALTGIVMTMQDEGVECGLDAFELIRMLEKSIKLYKDSDSIENLLEAKNLVRELYNEIIGA